MWVIQSFSSSIKLKSPFLGEEYPLTQSVWTEYDAADNPIQIHSCPHFECLTSFFPSKSPSFTPTGNIKIIVPSDLFFLLKNKFLFSRKF